MTPTQPTPTERGITMRAGGFATLVEALDHAAGARTGMTFHGPRGEVAEALGYARLAEAARDVGARLAGLGLGPGARIGIVAETEGDFARAFLGAVVAGLLPCPMPLPTAFGASDVYAGQLRRIAGVAQMSALVLPSPIGRWSATRCRATGSPGSARSAGSTPRPRPCPRRPGRRTSPICSSPPARRGRRAGSRSRIAR